MGNSIYKEEIQHSSDDLINKINKIATEYILEQNYSDMKQILDKNKCDENGGYLAYIVPANHLLIDSFYRAFKNLWYRSFKKLFCLRSTRIW